GGRGGRVGQLRAARLGRRSRAGGAGHPQASGDEADEGSTGRRILRLDTQWNRVDRERNDLVSVGFATRRSVGAGGGSCRRLSQDRKSTRLNSSNQNISSAVFLLQKI